MDKKEFSLFDFQDILMNLKQRNEDEEWYDTAMKGIDENSAIEDLPFYKDYLRKFDVDSAFEGFELANTDHAICNKNDLLLLFRLIAASFSSTYDILYDKSTNTIDIAISVSANGTGITKKVSELFSIQIITLFETYLNEQLQLFGLQQDPESSSEGMDKEQKIRLKYFEKQTQKIRDLQVSKGMQTELDILLNS